MKESPTSRSMKFLRGLGYIVTKAEQRLPIPGMFVTKDAFGFGDLLVCKTGRLGATLVQVTAAPMFNRRVNKIMGIPEDKNDEAKLEEYAKIRAQAIVWLSARNRIVVHEWKKKGPRGEPKRWRVRIGEVYVDKKDGIMKVREL